jgi:hypothetical protein
MDVLDEIISEMAKKFDWEYQTRKLSQVSARTLEGKALLEFLNKFHEVAFNVSEKLALTRRFSCKSRPVWERCNRITTAILRNLLVNPTVMELLDLYAVEAELRYRNNMLESDKIPWVLFNGQQFERCLDYKLDFLDD